MRPGVSDNAPLRSADDMTWTHGYISDVGYPAFFYKEMQPLWLSTVAVLRGVTAPDTNQPFALCELGCGVGINLLIAAACHPDARFTGVDFNEEHLRIARDAATTSGIDNIRFVHANFAEFAQSNRQQFDFISSHGVWSWIAPDYQAAMLDCVSHSLKPDGLFYLHYMCHPGSTDLLPLQHLLNLCAHHMPGPSPRKAQVGLKLLQQIAGDGLYADKPAMLRHLANMAQRDPADLAHEFLTDHWRPQHSVDLHQQVSRSGLTLLGGADMFSNLDISLSIPGKLQGLIRRTNVPALAETLKDMARNAHQRMDLFQKNPTPLSEDRFIAAWSDIRFRLLPHAPQHGPINFATPIGPVTGSEAIYTPLLQRLAAGPATGAELLQLPIFSGQLGELLQSLQLLMMQEIVHPVNRKARHEDEQIRKLALWFERQAIVLDIIADCASAVRRA